MTTPIKVYGRTEINAWTMEWEASPDLKARYATAAAFIGAQLVTGRPPAGFEHHPSRPGHLRAIGAAPPVVQPTPPATADQPPPSTALRATITTQEPTMAQASESDRIAGFDRLLTDVTGSDNRRNAAAIVTAAKANGKSVPATALELIGAGVFATSAEQLRAVYADSAALQQEFPTAEAYVAYRRDEMRRAGRPMIDPARVPAGASTEDAAAYAKWNGSAALQRDFPSAAAYAAHQRYEARKGR